MSEQRDLPSDSDESDVDFKPEVEESLSEEDSDGCVEETPLEQGEEENTATSGKRKKRQTKLRKRNKKNKVNDSETPDEPEESEEVKKLSAEEEKKKADSLWNDFMKDCPQPVRKPQASSDSKAEVKETEPAPTPPVVIEREIKALVTETYEFAGEKITVEKVVPAQGSGRGRGRGRGGVRGGAVQGRAGGLAAVLGQLGKKNKLSTLEKSKLDWDRFKKSEGIEEDIQTHNKGKEGYLERQDFLQRTDLRQFEIEKQLRTTKRSNR